MNRIKKIIEALRVLSRTPSKTIREAVSSTMIDAHNRALEGKNGATDEQVILVENLLLAVVAIAEDMEKEKPAKAAAESEAAK